MKMFLMMGCLSLLNFVPELGNIENLGSVDHIPQFGTCSAGR